MKILHFILGKANPDRANGVNQVINGLAKYQSLKGNTVYVLGLSKTATKHFEVFERDGFKVEVYPSFFNGSYKRIKELAADIDIVHLHGVWNQYNIIIGRYLHKIGKPYIISTHAGMADDRLRQSNYILKKTYHLIFQRKLFDNAAGLHAITREETTDISKHSNNNNIFFVPNGIDIKNYPFLYETKSRSVIKACYLGRLSVEKNMEGLIKAFYLLPPHIKSNIKLYLLGPKDPESCKIESLVSKLNLEDTVIFHGGVYGNDKIEVLSQMDFYIHPAYSDVVSIAAMEAMAIGLPTIITRTSQVAYYYNTKTFIMVEPNEKDIATGILEMIDCKEMWYEIAVRTRKLVENEFNWESSTDRILIEYSKVIKNQE